MREVTGTKVYKRIRRGYEPVGVRVVVKYNDQMTGCSPTKYPWSSRSISTSSSASSSEMKVGGCSSGTLLSFGLRLPEAQLLDPIEP